MPEQIVVDRLVKQFAGGNRALDEVSFTVEPGTFLVLLGPSGSGKTTLLRCLAGIERVTNGSIRIGDQFVASRKVHIPPERRDLSMVFQDYALWPHLVAKDNVAFALRRRGHSRAECRRIAEQMLERVGLLRLADRFPNELSGGEQQRVALARALVADTGLVLCDEPLSNLDADLRDRLRVEISSLVREAGATAIYITHDQSEAFALADQVGLLDHGHLVQLGAPERIYFHPATPFVARFTGLAGEISVVVSDRRDEDGVVEVAPSGLARTRVFSARDAFPAEDARSGRVMIRPAAVTISPLDDETHVVGSVTDVAFRGRGYEHVIDLPGGERISGVMSERRFERHASVGLRFDDAGCHFFSDARLANGSAPDREAG
ncbi:MAG: ABC transporter ATP-binding protein [Acidimicrobiales bacterium]